MPDEVVHVPSEPPARPTGTLALLERALELKLTAADLSAWMDLHERSEAAKAKAAFACALSAAQSEMPCIVKDAENKFLGTKYARLETIVHDIKPVYTRHGLSLSFEQEECQKPGFIRVRADLRHDAGHLQQYRVEMPLDGSGSQGGKSGMNPLQAHGSTFQYARRYLTCLIFDLVIAGQDLDGNFDAECIGPGQKKELEDLIARSGADLQRFLVWAKIEKIEQMRVADFEKARRMLNDKLKGGAK
jgi:hypothetical protein